MLKYFKTKLIMEDKIIQLESDKSSVKQALDLLGLNNISPICRI